MPVEEKLEFKKMLLKDFEIQIIKERLHDLRQRVDELQIWMDFKDIKNLFALRGLDDFFNRIDKQKLSAKDLLFVFRHGVYQEWLNNL